MIIKDHEVIFFNGDSVTDCGRDRQDRYSLSGYVSMISDKIKKNIRILFLKFLTGVFRETDPVMF